MAAAAEVEGELHGGPIVDGGDDALGHVVVEWNGGVEEVSGREEEAESGECGDGAGESGDEPGGAAGHGGD